MTSKCCTACGCVKPLDLFPKNSASPDGRYSLCKPCRAARQKEWRQRPDVKERETQRLAKAYLATKPQLLERRRVRYQQNREATLSTNRAWREAHLEQHRAQCRKWAKDNPEAMRVIVRNRRARLMAADGKHTQQDIQELFTSQKGLCVYCAIELADDFHVDHIHPLVKGGGNGPDNLQLLCPTCNRRKSAKLPQDFLHGLARAP